MKIIRDFVTNSSEPDYYSDCYDCDCKWDCDCNDDCDDCYDDCRYVSPEEDYFSHIDDPSYYDADGNYILDD